MTMNNSIYCCIIIFRTIIIRKEGLDMKAAVVEGYRKIAVRDIEEPKPDGKKVLIKVSKCGICGSDYHYYFDHGDSLKGLSLIHI